MRPSTTSLACPRIAQQLELSVSTIESDFRKATALLRGQLSDGA
jgi:DNA-directed RNA polymerase specialized sigma24 family protein